jgi:hypothetical protein
MLAQIRFTLATQVGNLWVFLGLFILLPLRGGLLARQSQFNNDIDAGILHKTTTEAKDHSANI